MGVLGLELVFVLETGVPPSRPVLLIGLLLLEVGVCGIPVVAELSRVSCGAKEHCEGRFSLVAEVCVGVPGVAVLGFGGFWRKLDDCCYD